MTALLPGAGIDSSFDGPVSAGSPELAALLAHIDAGVIDRDDAHRHPFQEFEAVRSSRLGALRLPGGRGGGATLTELFEVVIDIGEVDPNVAHSLRNHFSFVETLLKRHIDADEQWFAHIEAGQLFGLASTELNRAFAGGRDQPYETAITDGPEGLRLNGTKFYSTGNLYADFLLVRAQGPGSGSVRVIVPADRDGVSIEHDWDGIGQRFTGSGTTRFDNVAVELPEFFGTGAYGETSYAATFPQLYLTAVIAGILRRVTRDAAELVRTKQRTFYHAASESPVEDPILQQSVGLLASQAYAAEALVLHAADALADAYAAHGTDRELELSQRAALRAAKAKVVVDEIALKAASDLFDVGGGTAARQSSHLDRHWRNIRTLAAHNPRTYKAKAIGAYEISGEALPNGAFF
ncbi:acyl-CoA dehydrogenase family protein [Rhodococcoides yunnanense]|uniref:acyl-CoA dehydrogenase family protein n=1 Tax=Rhodococcoides yunnanense TaxID=278209 RepID=UPI0009340B97|nr:acyl-CoA dehydrogenase family protein [Rhodococcus yunnanensis]